MRTFGLVIFFAATALAQVPFEQMKRSTVHIRGEVTNPAGMSIYRWTGSGMVIADGRHIVTNWHVCCDTIEKPPDVPPHIDFTEASRKLEVAVRPDRWVPATVVWSETSKDLSILRIEEDSARPAVTFAPRKLCSVGQRIYALGFPGAAAGMTDDAGREEVKVVEGIISAIVRANPKRTGILSGVHLYQSSASTNPGNSGGPVFDECGRVVAIHSASARNAEGVKWEVQADELLSVLPTLKLTPSVAETKCSLAPVKSEGRDIYDYAMLGGQVLTAVLALAAIAMASTRRGRDYVKKMTTSYRHQPPPVRGPKGKPALRGVSGYYANSTLELEGEAFVLGRDSRSSNLVFPTDTANVSRRHCSVSWDQALSRFVLEDNWSTNGTFLDNGERLTPGKRYELKAGERFYLGSPDNQFEVRLEETK